jgi:hypothetical protein
LFIFRLNDNVSLPFCHFRSFLKGWEKGERGGRKGRKGGRKVEKEIKGEYEKTKQKMI